MKNQSSCCSSFLRYLIVGGLLLAIGTLPSWQALASEPREEAYLQDRLLQSGNPIAPDAYDRAAEQWQRLSKAKPSGGRGLMRAATVSGVKGTVWKPIGPSPLQLDGGFVNGRVHAIALNPNNPKVIYQGVNIGGVWKTIDGGATWVPLWDQQPSLGIGQPSAIAIDPNNTDVLYVGANSRFQQGKGILKSTDGGASWIVLGSGFPVNNNGNSLALFNGRNVNAIVVEPANS